VPARTDEKGLRFCRVTLSPRLRQRAGAPTPLIRTSAVGLAVLFSWDIVTGVAEGFKWGLVVALARRNACITPALLLDRSSQA
jgi:hypothetical protein